MEKTMTRLASAALIAICLVSPLIPWAAVGGGPAPRAGSREQADAAIDHRSLPLLRDQGVQEQLGLDAEQNVAIGRILALTLDPDQEDLIRMILCQFHADRDRLHDLEDPEFDDDEERRDEMTRLKLMAGGFRDRTAAMVDRVLTPGQRAALGPRPCPPDPDALFKSLSDLQRDSLRGIAADLTRHQQDRLRQLTLCAEGALAVVRPEVSARLNLTLDQQARIRAIWRSAQVDLDRLRDPNPVSPAYREGDDLNVWMRPRLLMIREESARILSTAAERISEVRAESQAPRLTRRSRP
jgi:hypothetical protein